jgi:lambda family phage portal protein
MPMASAAILDMNMSAGYREAELIAARVAACQMGIWERPANASGKIAFDAVEDNKRVMDMEPGKFIEGAKGWIFKQLNPTHPGQNLPGFLKVIMRSIASGLDVSYNDFANDLEGVNFSSLRAGTLSERDGWKMDQAFFIENFCLPVFAEWLTCTLLSGKTFLPLSKFEKFNKPVFVPRRWDWVDPLKDIKAHREALEMNIAAPQEVIEAAGRDPEEVLEMIQTWNELTKAYGILPPAPQKTLAVDKSTTEKGNEDNDEDEEQ